MSWSMGLLGAATSVSLGSYDLLATEILTSNTANVTFSNLNSTYGSTYQHLQLRMVTRTDGTSTDDYPVIQFNSDTASSYGWHQLAGNGSTVASNANATYSSIITSHTADASSSANSFGTVVLDILDPFETTKYTTTRSLGGHLNLTYISLFSGLWENTAAITTIDVLPLLGSNFVSGSRFSLYGLKVA